MRKLVDISGTEFVAPFCPKCKKGVLVQNQELNIHAQPAAGIFRCPNCYHAFRYAEPV